MVRSTDTGPVRPGCFTADSPLVRRRWSEGSSCSTFGSESQCFTPEGAGSVMQWRTPEGLSLNPPRSFKRKESTDSSRSSCSSSGRLRRGSSLIQEVTYHVYEAAKAGWDRVAVSRNSLALSETHKVTSAVGIPPMCLTVAEKRKIVSFDEFLILLFPGTTADRLKKLAILYKEREGERADDERVKSAESSCSSEQLAEYRDMFVLFTGGKDHLPFADLRKITPYLSEAFLRPLFDTHDFHKNGELDFHGFVLLMTDCNTPLC
eukprot:TRINITY_DN526_c0_g5_i1.p1 TRINITY_DN526_c0_g5~~TRINITY_DN526_c0_g5_i1.p1  ORF type:complete len:281 (+),score=40.41 TRINITY_DN526_c0_g5_i1:55-843(+)